MRREAAAVWASLCLAACAPAAGPSGALADARAVASRPIAAPEVSPILLYGPGRGGTTDGAFCPEIAVDGGGTTFATGELRRPERIGGVLVGGDGQAGRWLVALRPDGSLAWSRALPGVDNAVIAADQQGRGMVLAGRLTRALDLGEGSLGTDEGGLFVARFDEAGKLEWNRTVTSVPMTPTFLERDVAGVFVDHEGAVWLRATRDDRASGTSEVYVEQFDAAGGSRWSARFAPATELDAGLPGRPRNGAMSGGELVFVLDRAPSMTLVALSDLGIESWSRPWPAAVGFAALAFDVDGSVYAAGALPEAADFGGGALPGPGRSMEEDIYVAKYDSRGVHVWSYRFGEVADAEIGGVVVDERDRIWIHGTARNGIVFAPGIVVPAAPPAPAGEARDRVPFVVVLTAEGTPRRALRVAGRGALGGSIVAGPRGVTLVARYVGELTLDGLAGPAHAQPDHLGCALVRIPVALGR